MRKVETPEKLAARKAKEQKELAKWRREQLKPKRKLYLIYLVVVLSLVFIMDNVATEICTKMKAEICGGLFGGSTATMDLLGMLASAVMIGGAIYKSMSDRFGRKIFLVINTIAMGAGMFIVYLAGAMGSAAVYIIGSLFISFFIAHDMQAVYVLETMPKTVQTVFFGGMGERLEITHHSYNWECFARGACDCAAYLKDKPAGFYTIKDVIAHIKRLDISATFNTKELFCIKVVVFKEKQYICAILT